MTAFKTDSHLCRKTLPQAAAICVRDGHVLLISSRETGRWVIPKGNVERHESHADCAAREAMEEAGILGQIDDLTLGHYQYFKERRKALVGVAVFRLTVSDRLTDYREMGQRDEIWLSPADAADLVLEAELKAIFSRLAERF